MKRYLIYFSYLGTNFRGLQKQFNKGVPIFEKETVQSVLELGLNNLKDKPINKALIYPASRTDRGVHALCTAAHVDLEFKNDFFPAYQIIKSLNTFFIKYNYDIRILNIRVVPESFSARYSVLKKRYLYRFAILKADIPPDIPNKKYITPTPIIEHDRCLFVFNPVFDVDIVRKTLPYFIGLKNFRSFMSRQPDAQADLITERFIETLELIQGKPLIQSKETDYYNFWEISCCGRSFLYKQVRRMVGALLAVGQGRIDPDEVKFAIDDPINNPWPERAVVVPGCGLYLTNVEYSEEDLKIDGVKEIREKILKLAHTSTIVMFSDGKVINEEFFQGNRVVKEIPSSSHGYIVDTTPDLQIAEIIPGLFLGSQDPVYEEELLKAHGITNILSIGCQIELASKSNQFDYNFIQALDLPEFDMISVFERCFAYIDSVIESGGSVFVHCNAGISRSPTVVIAYLIKERSISYDEAYSVVKNVRPSILPNPGFIQQLKFYEQLNNLQI